MPILLEGLKKLNQADASVEVFVQDTGEYVINAAGEMHLERCLRDLEEMFAPIPLEVSPPIVSFKETIIQTGKTVIVRTRGKVCQIKISAKPLPPKIVKFLSKEKSKIASVCIVNIIILFNIILIMIFIRFLKKKEILKIQKSSQIFKQNY